ncbi:hypothetical protein D3C86_1302900 [compost metagenome]
MHRCRSECLPINAGHGARRLFDTLFAGQPDRAFDHVAQLQHQDDDSEDGGGRHRIAPDRIAHVPREEQHGQQQVRAHGRVPHALPGIQPTFEFQRRELGQHGHRNGEVDAVSRADKEAAHQNDLETGRKHHQQRADHGQELGDDQGPDASPAVGHPPADGVEGDGDPRRERRHQRHLASGQAQVARHGSQCRAQGGIGEGIQKQSAQRQPPDKAGPASNTGA